VAEYLPSLVQKMRSAPRPFYPQTRANADLLIPQNQLRGELAAREAPLVPQISL